MNFLQLPTSQRCASSRFSTLSLTLFREDKLWMLSPKKTWLKHKKARDLMPCICRASQFMLLTKVGVFDLAKIKFPKNKSMWENWMWECCLHQNQSTKKHEFGSWNPELTDRCFLQNAKKFQAQLRWGTQFWDELPICQRQKDPQKVWFTLCSQVTLHERGLEPHLPRPTRCKILFGKSLGPSWEKCQRTFPSNGFSGSLVITNPNIALWQIPPNHGHLNPSCFEGKNNNPYSWG